MNKLKIIIFCITLFVCMCLMSACLQKEESPETVYGIEILGDIEGEGWETVKRNDMGYIYILSNDIVLKGEATTDVRIVCREAVTKLAIEGLNQGKHSVVISATTAEDTSNQLSVSVCGENNLRAFELLKSAAIIGDGDEAKLSLTGGVTSTKALAIKNLELDGAFLKAGEKIDVTGKSNIVIDSKSDTDIEFSVKAEAINLSLTTGGKFTIKRESMVSIPLVAEKKLELGENNQIILPENGEITTAEEAILDPAWKVIGDSDTGELAEEIIISNRSSDE